jgi:hypothetical protein
MHDQPAATELLEAVAAFLENVVVPKLEGGRRFHAIVAANAVRIVAREIELGPATERTRAERLWALLGNEGAPPAGTDAAELVRELSTELCTRIEAGDADEGPWRREVLEHLKHSVREQLAVDNPRFDWDKRA